MGSDKFVLFESMTTFRLVDKEECLGCATMGIGWRKYGVFFRSNDSYPLLWTES